MTLARRLGLLMLVCSSCVGVADPAYAEQLYCGVFFDQSAATTDGSLICFTN